MATRTETSRLDTGDEPRETQFWEFPFETQVFRCYARVDSMGEIQEVVRHLGIDRFFLASFSWMAKNLGDQVQAFLLWLIEQTTPYAFVDAPYYKTWNGVLYITKVVLW
jgi:hypothetical protein